MYNVFSFLKKTLLKMVVVVLFSFYTKQDQVLGSSSVATGER